MNSAKTDRTFVKRKRTWTLWLSYVSGSELTVLSILEEQEAFVENTGALRSMAQKDLSCMGSKGLHSTYSQNGLSDAIYLIYILLCKSVDIFIPFVSYIPIHFDLIFKNCILSCNLRLKWQLFYLHLHEIVLYA